MRPSLSVLAARTLLALPVIVAMGLGGARAAAAGEKPIFKWYDPDGNLHVTDRLGNVPEPYYSMYLAIEREKEAAGKAQPNKGSPDAPVRVAPSAPKRPPSRKTVPAAPRGSTSSVPSTAGAEAARRAEWKALLEHWRRELQAATAELEAIDADIAAAKLNPLLRYTPPVQAKIAELEDERTQTVNRLNKARKMLLETLPERARREQVPPKWLE